MFQIKPKTSGLASSPLILVLFLCIGTSIYSYIKLLKVDAQLVQLSAKIDAIGEQNDDNKIQTSESEADSAIDIVTTYSAQPTIEQQDPKGRSKDEISKQIDANKTHLDQYQKEAAKLGSEVEEALRTLKKVDKDA